MSDRNDNLDKELNETLKGWPAPDAPPELERRLLASYRQRMPAVPWWKRLLTTTVSVPVPVAALVLLGFVFSLGFALRTRGFEQTPVSSETNVVVVHGPALPAIVTTADLTSFRPPREMTLRVIRKGADHEN